MTSAEVVAWADKHYRPVLNKFGDDPPDGLTLSLLELENFEKAYGPTVGPAFFKALVKQGTPLYFVSQSGSSSRLSHAFSVPSAFAFRFLRTVMCATPA